MSSEGTFIFFSCFMYQKMAFEFIFPVEGRGTLLTSEWFLLTMYKLVGLKIVLCFKLFATHFTIMTAWNIINNTFCNKPTTNDSTIMFMVNGKILKFFQECLTCIICMWRNDRWDNDHVKVAYLCFHVLTGEITTIFRLLTYVSLYWQVR